MRISERPFRSVLYMPGANARALEKAKTLPADALILDLEDAVAPSAKEESRERVRDAVKQGGYAPRYVMVRVNGFDTEWGVGDIAEITPAGPGGIVIPKVESAKMIEDVRVQVGKAGGSSDILLWCMLETPRGILEVAEIAAVPGIGGLIMGTSDLTKDLSAEHTEDRSPMLYSLSICLLAARANGLVALDGVHLDLGDDKGFREQCRQGRELGFDGKTLIHPKTLSPANEIFGPSGGEVKHARQIIEAHAEAEAAGKGVTLLDGKLIENLHVEIARRTVAKAEAIEELAGAA